MADIRITPASSVMSFTSSLNYIEKLTQDASGSLNLYGSGSTGRTELLSIDGNNGRLFTVSDDLSDSLFSVNTIAGLPVIEAFANNSVNIGQYTAPPIKVTGSQAIITGSLFGTASYATFAQTPTVTGATGVVGVTGATGPVGVTGATGVVGVSGATGVIGVSGATGVVGVSGATGLTGATGVVGVSGATGLTGATGAVGVSGATGVVGVSGATGLTGATGIVGVSGATGVVGVSGATGVVGVSGATGVVGVSGATGLTGATGAVGVSGATGVVGVSGATGLTGATGVVGVSGATGVVGVTGATGVVGVSGATGITGPVAGSANQVVYKNSSNVAAGSANLVFDGTTLSAAILNGPILSGGSSGNLNTDFNNTTANTFKYQGDQASLTNSPGNTWWFYQNMRHSNASNYWGTQVAWGWEDNANRLATRNVTGGTFGAWVYYLNSANYNSYAPTLTGGGASGTSWAIGITGNAGSVTYSPNRNDGSPYPVLWGAAYTNGIGTMAYSAAAVTITSSTGTLSATTLAATTQITAPIFYETGTTAYYVDPASLSRLFELTVFSGVKTGVGFAGAPTYTFYDDTNTGMYNVGADSLGFATAGVKRLEITAAGAMGLGITPTNTSGRFEATNDIVAYSTSDKRWKNNIKNIDSSLEKLSQINGVEFDWIEDEPFHGNKGHDVGVIAQEVELVIPEAVQTRESGMKAVQYDKIIPLLIEAIKELQKQIKELKK